MLVETKVFNNNQIKSLPTTPLVVLSATTGRVILFDKAVVTLDAKGGDYGNLDPTSCKAFFDYSSGIIVSAAIDQNSIAFWNPGSATDKISCFIPLALQIDSPTRAYVDRFYDSECVSKGLRFVFSNGAAGNLNGGHANNTLSITVYYDVITV